MDYEKKYNAAFERAKQFSEKPFLEDSAGIVEYIFHELAESDDEKVRKELLEFLDELSKLGKNTNFDRWSESDCATWICWLEKQGQVKESQIFQHENKTCKGKDDSLTSEDERIKNEIIAFVEQSIHRGGGTPIPQEQENKWISWLEKQGEQKPAIIIQKFRVGDEIKTNNEESLTITKIDEKGYWSDDLFICGFDEECIWDLVGWKPDDKAEPKFKVGDWIMSHYNHVAYVKSIDEKNYSLSCNDGISEKLSIDCINRNWRLWTIQDAKDGDALSDGTTIFIFKDLLSDGSVMSYCDYDTDSGESDAFCPLSMNLMCSKITPVTKEQRDLLFQKMKEAGYEWDADKKELKKIEQGNSPFLSNSSNIGKNAWSEKDEHWRQKAIDFMKHPDLIKATPTLAKDTIDWLKSLKDRVQPRQEWSKEDIEMLNSAISFVEHSAFTTIGKGKNNVISWLKSLKDRIHDL